MIGDDLVRGKLKGCGICICTRRSLWGDGYGREYLPGLNKRWL
jgi:hypothetical protein